MKASCRSWRLVKCEYVLSCFSECVLTRERAVCKRLVGLGVLLSVDKGACLLKASCRSWLFVKRECVLSCFSERVLKWESAVGMRLVGLLSLLYMNTSCRCSISGIASSTFSV